MSLAKTANHKDDLRALVFCPGPMGIFEQSLALEERGWLQTMAIDYYCDLPARASVGYPKGGSKNICASAIIRL